MVEQVLKAFDPTEAIFWSTHGGGELDLVFFHGGERLGFVIKFAEAQKVTASMRTAQADLKPAHLYVVHAGAHRFPMEPGITAAPLSEIPGLPGTR